MKTKEKYILSRQNKLSHLHKKIVNHQLVDRGTKSDIKEALSIQSE